MSDMFFIRVGFVRPDDTMEAIGAFDSVINVLDDERVGTENRKFSTWILEMYLDPTIDRERLPGNALDVDSSLLRNFNRRGLGRMLVGLNNYLMGINGVKKYAVEHDTSTRGREGSFYLALGAQMEKGHEPESGDVPTFDTADFTAENRLNGLAGYWLPMK